jgi:hypothetical protein
MPLWLQVSLDLLATVATAVAAVFAAITIWQAKRQPKASQDASTYCRAVAWSQCPCGTRRGPKSPTSCRRPSRGH